MNRSEPRPHTERLFYKVIYTTTIFRLVDWLYRWLGRRVFNAVSSLIARVYARTHPEIRAMVADNLALLTGRRDDSKAREVFRNFGLAISDYVCTGNMRPADVRAWVTDYRGMEHIEAAHRAGRGAILATGHFGFFELGGHFLGQRGLPVTALTLPEPSPALTQWRADFRARWGVRTLAIGADPFASLEVVRELNKGHLCAMLVDRPFDSAHRLAVSLPGGRTAFSTSAALLAYLADCPLIPVATSRLPGGTYRILAKPAIRIDRSLGRQASVTQATLELAGSLFEEIQQCPTQWYQFVSVRC
ncbi:MAG TPA: lysophospholipid acyltransferase family protein [Chthoniobacterales bacterium]